MTTSADRPPLVPGISDLSPLHVGGSGAVYRGCQQRLERLVAVKVIVSQEPDAVRVRRFERECAILGELGDQRYVLRLYDSGYLHGGRPYLVTELCTGGSLAERLARQGPLSVGEVTDIGRSMAAVLRRMHGAGLLHRDVKPGNILLRADGDPVLADFGMAVRAGEVDSGPAMASPGHTAPEVLTTRRWTPAADVFALGSTLSTVLTGVLPEPSRAGPTGSLSVGSSEGNVPASLSTLLAEMLAVEPAVRPSAAEVVDRLTRTASALPGGATARPPAVADSADSPTAGLDAPITSAYVAPVTQPLAGSGRLLGSDLAPSARSASHGPDDRWRRPFSRARLPGPRAVVALLAGLAGALVAVWSLTGWPFQGSGLAARLGDGGTPIRPVVAASPRAHAPTLHPPVATSTGPQPGASGTAGSQARDIVPPGFRLVRGPQGIVVAVPGGWIIRAVPGTSELRAADPQDPRGFLQFGGYRPGHATQLGRVRGYADSVREQDRDYRQLRLGPVTFGDSPDAVDWEYTDVGGGGTRHAYGRYWRLGDAEYVAYANAPAEQWSALLPTFRVLLSSAQPR